jgi:hypothetical protein
MYVDGKLTRCGQVGSFAVDAGYRSLGPAVLLQRTTFQPVDSGEIDFCYDCPPHDQGMSTFVRMGMRANCEVIRYALPLGCDEHVHKRLGTGMWTKPLIGMGNVLLKARGRGKPTPGLTVEEEKKSFGEEFDRLDERVPSTGIIRASRSARVLNWRYLAEPKSQSRVLVIRRAGELLGFLSFRVCGERAYLVDIFGLELPAIAPALLHAAIALCRREGVCSIHGFCSTDSELRPVFTDFGFRPRHRDARVVAYEKAGAGRNPLLNHGLRWKLSHVEVLL